MFKKKLTDTKSSPSNLVTLTKPSSVISEQFKTIRTNIQFSIFDKEIKTIAITSDMMSAGKSTVAANLAITFSMQGKKVVLIDSDMRKPTIHHFFNLSNRDGLTSLLTDRAIKLSNMIHHTGIENLFILTSGIIPPNPSELLASKRMDELLVELETEFDLIIFDLPPVMAVTDAQIMASKVDGTIFVIRKDSSTKDRIMQSKNLLQKVNANVIGVVLNRIKVEESLDYGYYGITD
ncbi:CpsD/CapB family tyrosine-protein kinase [Carnobacterium funditum]|uniref:CpsD/CapB family tyrosine-protein kinase n=1 Tax=Carnobacterium funditum TaxID=2752 RepID=UPI000552A00B|nr:CpsD/CapB family tyrosine-protein kinase [Carnobacterium funditum]